MIANLALVIALSPALAPQAPANVPADAEVIYPVMPTLVPVTNADGSKVALHQSIHSVTVTLSKGEASYEVLSLFKNTTDVEGNVSLALAFGSWRHGFGEAIKVEALWSDQRVEQTGVVVIPPVPEKGQVGTYSIRFTLSVKKQATHSLKLKFKLPVGKSGVDREERMVAYKVSNIGQAQALEQFRMAVKYSPAIVFAPIESKPDWGWQVGSDGAYLKLDGRASNRDAVLTYRYYPAGF